LLTHLAGWKQAKKNAADHAIAKEILTEYELIGRYLRNVTRERPELVMNKKNNFQARRVIIHLKVTTIVAPDGRDILMLCREPDLKAI
jgi:hypothetical protein